MDISYRWQCWARCHTHAHFFQLLAPGNNETRSGGSIFRLQLTVAQEPKLKIAVISPSAQSLQEIGATLEHGHASRVVTRHQGGISKLAALAEQERPDVIIVEGLCHDASEIAPIEAVTTHYPQLMVIMLCSQQSSEFLINAMRVGVREVLSSPVSKVALEAAIGRAEAKLGLRPSQRRARVVSFLPCKGGSGATFLATNLGYQIAAEGKKVLLIDLNLQFGDALLTVHDRKATTDIVDIARNISRLDASFLSASSVHVSPNFEILDAPVDPAQSLQFKPEHLDAILNVAASQYDFVILDVSRNLDDVTIKALDRSHTIFLVVQLLLPCLRNATRMMTVFRSLDYPPEKIELVVNRYWKNGEIGLDDLRASFGLSKMRVIPNGYKEVANAINRGEPLISLSKSSAVTKAIGELAQSLAPKSEQAQGGLLSRLLKH
jgi:pilus assembly protein CpaE